MIEMWVFNQFSTRISSPWNVQIDRFARNSPNLKDDQLEDLELNLQRSSLIGSALKINNLKAILMISFIALSLLSVFPCLSFSYMFSCLFCIFPSQLFQPYSNQFSTTSPYFGFQKTTYSYFLFCVSVNLKD